MCCRLAANEIKVAEEVMGELQVACGVSSGGQLLHMAMRLHQESNPYHAIVSLDVKNVYESAPGVTTLPTTRERGDTLEAVGDQS